MIRDPVTTWPTSDPRVAEIIDILAKETGVDRDRLTPDATMQSLDIASLDLVQAMFAIETQFNVEVPVAANQPSGEFTTVGDMVRHILMAIGIPR